MFKKKKKKEREREGKLRYKKESKISTPQVINPAISGGGMVVTLKILVMLHSIYMPHLMPWVG